MINDLLFVYGTLLIADNESASYLTRNSAFCCKGKIKGKLYDVGNYPGVIIGDDDNYDVWGTVCRLHHAQEVLKYLDHYEGFGKGEERPYLFVREALCVETEQETLTCWVYLYNRSVKGLYQIPSGDYLTYFQQS